MQFINHTIATAAGATSTNYIPVPYRCVIVGVKAVADYEAGNDTTVDLYNDTTKQFDIDLDTTTTLADVATGVLAATTIFEAGTAIKVVASDDEASASGNVNLVIEIDPFLSGVSDT